MSGEYDAGAAAFAAGDIPRAIAHFEAQLAAEPDHAATLVDLGVARFMSNDVDAAIVLFEKALAILPGNALVETNLARAFDAAGRPVAAEALWRKVIARAPADPVPRHELGKALLSQGRHGAAHAAFATAVELSGGALRVHCWRAYLNTLNYMDDVPPQRILAENMRFAAEYTPPGVSRPAPRDRDRARKLRIGYVTSDLRSHSVARNMLGIFLHRDRARYEAHVYAEIERPDEFTELFRGLSDRWTSTLGLDDDAAARRIAADGIDVLVLVAGHFDRNRAGILLRRPAPVQLAVYDICTQGSEAIDAIVLDPTMCAGRADLFVERPLKTRHVYVHPPFENAPAVGPAPCRTNGFVTFGSANNPAKMSATTYAMWAAALKAVPQARLALKFMRAYEEPAVRAGVCERFAARGVDPARISFDTGGRSRDGHLAFYNRIDVALDTFPFTGSTTTFEALWMGVPVVTLRGRTVPQRWTAAILARARREEWCADDIEGFARIAARLAAESPNQDRAVQQSAIAGSSLCDLEGQARAYERLYRAMWARACRA
ncbi:MAG: tetratricopeptide repeat protein [Alphaproteobacteria bacterium]|nr:tetratricopeptide repeat protein [Alphaproteobacteria bacterium]